MSFDPTEARTKLDALREQLNAAASVLSRIDDSPRSRVSQKPTAKETQEHYDKIAERLTQIDSALDDLGEVLGIERATEFSTFLSTVGESMVAAQRELDGRSERYLGGLGRHVMPSVFRIPKVSAEIKFAMQEVSKRGFRLGFGRQQESEQSLNQSLKFEVAAVPPPVELAPELAAGRLAFPRIAFLYDLTLRGELLRDLARVLPGVRGGLASSLPNTPPHPVERLAEAGPRTLIWTVSGVEGFLLLFADAPSSDHPYELGIWHLTYEDEDALRGPQVKIVRKYGTQLGKGKQEQLVIFQQIIYDLGSKQAAVFKELLGGA